MEVRLVPAVRGCITVPLTILTLGLWPVLQRFGERRFVARLDEAGFESRGGTFVGWGDVERVEHVVGVMGRTTLSEEYWLHTSKGRFSLPIWRTGNAAEVLDYFGAHIPPAARPH